MGNIADEGRSLKEIEDLIEVLKSQGDESEESENQLAKLQKDQLALATKRYEDSQSSQVEGESAARKEQRAQFYQTAGNVTTSGLSIVLILAALVIHLYHGIVLQFAMVWSQLIPIYLVLALFLAIVQSMTKRDGFFMFFRHFLVSILIVAIIILIMFVLVFASNNFSNPFIEDLSGFLLLLFPPLVYYLIFSPEYSTPRWMQTVASLIIVVFAIGFVFSYVGNMTLPIPDNYKGIDAKQGFKNTWNQLADGVKSFGERTYQVYNQTQQRLDPNYYIGTVEQNEQRPLGVRLEEVAPIDSVFFPNEPVTIFGYITAETFLADSISVGVSCHMTRRNDVSDTIVAPVDVYYGHDELFECVFNDGFDTGSYPVEVHASFPFETWADITYDFISKEKSLAFARLGVDVYRELDISKVPQAIYTNGPVMLGMGGSRMPILVTNESPYLENAYLGFTLQSKWPKGSINVVDSLELIIPNTFELSECDRFSSISAAGPFPDEKVSAYHKYVFKNLEANKSLYSSIRCKMGLTSPDALADLVANDKVTRTFIVRANYTYTLKEDIKIRVAG